MTLVLIVGTVSDSDGKLGTDHTAGTALALIVIARLLLNTKLVPALVLIVIAKLVGTEHTVLVLVLLLIAQVA